MEDNKEVTALKEGYFNDVLYLEGETFYVPVSARSTWFAAEGEEPLEAAPDIFAKEIQINQEAQLRSQISELEARLAAITPDVKEDAGVDSGKKVQGPPKTKKGKVDANGVNSSEV